MRTLVGSWSLLVLASSCGSSSSGGAITPAASNLGISSVLSFGVDGEELVALVSEEPGFDGNGDGDTLDEVLVLRNLRTGAAATLPYAVTNYSSGGGHVLFTASESGQGADLNGDTDLLDSVLFDHDPGTGVSSMLRAVSSSGLAGPSLDGSLFAFAVPEFDHGEDLDGDGLLDDSVLHVHDTRTGRLTNLELVTSERLLVSGERVFTSVLEENHGDLNGDGDAEDAVVHVYDARTGLLTNLARSAFNLRAAEGALVAFTISESAQGGEDLNGDGDSDDFLTEVHDIDAGTFHRTQQNALQLQIVDGLVAFVMGEDQGDLNDDQNGDGDTNDRILYFYDSLSGTLTSSRLSIGVSQGAVGLQPVLADRRAAFAVSELGENLDINQDGDLEDYFLALFDGRTGVVERKMIRLFPADGLLHMTSRYVACGVQRENPDGQTQDPIAILLDPSDGSIRDLDLSTTEMLAEGNHLAAIVSESGQGRDLNGDGDQLDFVAHLVRLDTADIRNTNLCVPTAPFSGSTTRFVIENGFFVAIAREACHDVDLNGDGDTDDGVLFTLPLL